MNRARISIICAAALFLSLSACGDLGYYAQCASGHIGVISRCRPITSLLEDPQTPAELKVKLETVQEIRSFASRDLFLPDNDSYRSYGDLKRPYVVWNVVAADEFSVTPQQWCFPVAGCVSYRGYFSEDGAESFAERERQRGRDVYVYGVAAYSTLNWFDDPVLNTFLGRPKPALAGLIFHELAHQVVYAEGDSRFNEAFATAVEIEGVARWLRSHGDEQGLKQVADAQQRHLQFVKLLDELKEQLGRLYESGLPEGEMRRGKKDLFLAAEADYLTIREEWGAYTGYDAFFAEGLNNAKLASVSTYQDLVPAFQRLLQDCDGDLPAFYRRVAKLAELPVAERHVRLQNPARIAGKPSQKRSLD